MNMVSYLENEVPRLTPEQEAEFERLFTLPDDEIDCSDIPELTEAELAEFRPWRDVMAERKARKQTAAV